MRLPIAFAVMGSLLVLTTVLPGQAKGGVSKGAGQPPAYLSFFPGMSRLQFLHAAQAANIPVECAPLTVYPGFPVLCQTPGTLDLMGAHQAITRTLVLAPMDSTGHAGFVMFLQVPLGDRTQGWLDERRAEWGEPSNGPEERTQWLREPYIAVVDADAKGRFIFVGYLDVMIDVFNRGAAIYDSQSTRGH